MSTMVFNLALAGADPVGIARAIVDAAPEVGGIPAVLEIGDQKKKAEPVGKWLGKADKIRVSFGPGEAPFLLVEVEHGMVKARFTMERSAAAVLAMLEKIDFDLSSFRSIHPEWIEWDYTAPGFADMHYAHGWGCAFRGRGHERLVSRRWLEQPLFQVHKGTNDTTLVQFHDLDVDAKQALIQAQPAHARMGITPEGGFIQTNFVHKFDTKGLYVPSRKAHLIMAIDRDVSQREMLEACAVRLEKRRAATDPIESIGYVFHDRARAEAHLPELWLRELECWLVDGQGKETRLDGQLLPKS